MSNTFSGGLMSSLGSEVLKKKIEGLKLLDTASKGLKFLDTMV